MKRWGGLELASGAVRLRALRKQNTRNKSAEKAEAVTAAAAATGGSV